MTAAEAAQLAGVSISTIIRARRAGIRLDTREDVRHWRDARASGRGRPSARRRPHDLACRQVDPGVRCPHSTKVEPASRCSLCLAVVVERIELRTQPLPPDADVVLGFATLGAMRAAEGWRS